MKSRYLIKYISFLPKKLFLRIINGGSFAIGSKSKVSILCSLRLDGSKSKLSIGSSANFRSYSEIYANGGEIRIGNNVFLNRGVMIVSHDSISIGNNVTIGPNTLIYDHDHDLGSDHVGKKPISIGENVWIAGNVTILKGVTIGDNSVISAGCVITKDIPANAVIVQKRQSTNLKVK